MLKIHTRSALLGDGSHSIRFLFASLLFAAFINSSFAAAFCQTPVTAKSSLITDDDLNARLAAIEKAVENRRRELGIAGLALAIVKDDKIIFIKGFGVRDINKNLPVTQDTLFAIGSTTKAFTSMLAVMSADDGKLSLDDSPKKFLPYFKLRDPEADAAVTLRDLLSHRTGLERTDLSLQFSGSMTREEVIKVAGLAKPSAKFREKWFYQNAMYSAAGEAAAKANGVSWEKLVETRIFKPLGMTKTTVSIAAMQQSKDFSLGYNYNPETKEIKNLKMIDLEKIAPAGAINSSASDMAQWLRLLLGGGMFAGKRLVSEKNFGELFTEQIQIAPKVGYSLGWYVRDWRGKKEVDHGGNIDGFNASVAMIPEERLGLVMLSNSTSSPLGNEIRQIVFFNLLGERAANSKEKTIAPAATDTKATYNANIFSSENSATLKEILGNYETEQKGTPIDIIAANNQVSFAIQGQPPRRLIEKEPDVFAVEGMPEGYNLVVKRDAGGKINNLTFNQRDAAAVLRRVTLPVDAPTIEELMKRVVEAAGGAANWRKHASMLITATSDLEYEGMTSEIITSAKAPNLSASVTKYYALGRQVGESFDFFDGTRGGGYTTDNKSIVGTPYEKSGKILEDARVAADFYQPLDWKTLYRTIEIKRVSKIAGEDVYVVVKTPENGHPVTDYISTKTFLVLRRETAQPTGGAGGATVPYVENFSDYKTVDGVMMPFKITSGVPGSKTSETIVKSIKFDVDLPDSAFRPASKFSVRRP